MQSSLVLLERSGVNLLVKGMVSIIIIISTGSIGYILAYRHIQRLQQLKNLYLAFQLLETEILYASTPLPAAMKKVGEKANKSISSFFTDTSRILNSKMGFSIEEAWTKAIENNFKFTALVWEDKEVVIDFGNNLGCTDRENQGKNFQLAYLQLKKQQEAAEYLRMKNEKMYKSLGILIGIAIVIIFI